MNTNTSLDPIFYHLLEENTQKKKQRNRQTKNIQIQHEKELIQFIADSQWSILISRTLLIQMDKVTIKALKKELYAESSSLLSYSNKSELLMKIIKFGNTSLNWKVSVPDPVYLLANNIPLLNEYDFIELAAFRKLETKFETSIMKLNELSVDERAGQILFSSIAYGALFTSWKQTALMESTHAQWVVEIFASWLELKSLKLSSQKKNFDDLCDDDYKLARWFPDPISELLILRFFEDFPSQENFKGCCYLQTLLFKFLRKVGVSKEEMPDSLAMFSRWASHSLALDIPPYMHNISSDEPRVTHISSESWLRMSSGKRVLKHDSGIDNKSDEDSVKCPTVHDVDLVDTSDQLAYINKIKDKLIDKKTKKTACIDFIKQQLDKTSGNRPSFISWLIAAFVLKLLQHGGLVKSSLEISTIVRYLSAIKEPLLNSFANIDTYDLTESRWVHHLQKAIEINKKDSMSRNRTAEFAYFIQQFDQVPSFDIDELEGISINKRVNANLVSNQEFAKALAQITYGGRIERMQRLAGTLGFYLGLRRGETIHILLKDIAGQASSELLIRSNRYYNTKNRTSRRLPLSTLLPAPLFHEFMLFYYERVEEENGEMGNKLLFCTTGNSTTPMAGKALLQPIVESLKAVTGDQVLTYHILRHSFANNLLLRLLIPEFPRLIVHNVDMFKNECFSIKSCMQLRQRLLPGAEKDVRTSVRDTLYQLAMLMGHASPKTTIQSYLHMFDWIIHRCLSDDNIKLSDEQVRKLLKEEDGQYWFELKNKFIGNVEKGYLNTDSVLQHVRKKHADRFINSTIAKVMRSKHFPAQPLFRKMFPSDLVQMLPMIFEKKHTIEEISERFNISPDSILHIKKSAEELNQIKTKSGRSRMPLALPSLSGTQQHKDLNKILNTFPQLRSNDKHIHFGLQKFIHGSPTTGMEVKLSKASEVKMYIKFLCKLGMPKTRIILWYYPDSNATESEQKKIWQWWAKVTGIPIERIFQKPSQRTQLSQDESQKIGWVSVFVCKDKLSYHKCSGVQQALHLLAVFNYGNY
ncbi:MAG: site-specific integrase [Mariprofundaceae bacterium]